jgi:hypothetical protein
MPPDLRKRAEALAEKEGATLSKVILGVLDRHLPHENRQPAPKKKGKGQ